MRVLIIGAAGMVGRKLTEQIVRENSVAGGPLSALDLYDAIEPATPASAVVPVRCLSGDIAAAGEAKRLVEERPDVIFHLAAIVSGEAEQNFSKGYAVNVMGTWNLFEEVRALNAASSGSYYPRLVFTSSTGVFGAPFPESIGDEFLLAPLTSYGAQKVMGELLLSDYTRKGYFDGIGIRLPTICVRPGRPNKAASGFFSSIIREPLAGKPAVLPVSEDVRHWHASPRSAVHFLKHAAAIDGSAVGPRRTLTMPGVSCTVAEQIDALRRVAGNAVAGLIRREPDEQIMKIVSGWPRRFDASRAKALGFTAENSFDEIVRIHIEDELGGRIGA